MEVMEELQTYKYERKRLETFQVCKHKWYGCSLFCVCASSPTFGSGHQSLSSNWIPFSTLTICSSGLACQCQGGGLEDGQGWSPVHRAGGRGAYQCAMFCMCEDKEPVPWKAVISKVDRRFISGYLCMVWLRSWRLAIWRPGVYN